MSKSWGHTGVYNSDIWNVKDLFQHNFLKPIASVVSQWLIFSIMRPRYAWNYFFHLSTLPSNCIFVSSQSKHIWRPINVSMRWLLIKFEEFAVAMSGSLFSVSDIPIPRDPARDNMPMCKLITYSEQWCNTDIIPHPQTIFMTKMSGIWAHSITIWLVW